MGSNAAIAPVRAGHVLDEKEFRSMSENKQRHTEKAIRRLTGELRKHLEQLPLWAKERRERTRELDRRIILLAVGRLIEEVRQKYEDLSHVVCKNLESQFTTLVPALAAPEGAAPGPFDGAEYGLHDGPPVIDVHPCFLVRQELSVGSLPCW